MPAHRVRIFLVLALAAVAACGGKVALSKSGAP